MEEQDHRFSPPEKALESMVHYKVESDSSGKSYMKASTHMSSTNDDEKDFVPHSCFKNNYDWYTTQKSFNEFENTLKTTYCDEAKTFIITEKIDYSLHAWLEMKLLEDEPNKMTALNKYCDSNASNNWWKKIEKNFKSIFGPVVHGLRELHGKEKTHGNLLNGVAIKELPNDTPTGVLFNMANDSTTEFKRRSQEDIVNLNRLLRWVLMYPFLQPDYRCAIDPKFVDDCEYLCFLQLQHRLENEIDLGTWTLNLALFWEKSEIITFMRSVYRLIGENQNLRDVVACCFTPNWKERVKESGNGDMIDVLSYNNDTYSDHAGLEKLRFWRNCLEHMKFITDKEMDTTKIEEAIHEIVIEFLPDLFREAVSAYHKYMVEVNKMTPDESKQQTPNVAAGSKQQTPNKPGSSSKRPRAGSSSKRHTRSSAGSSSKQQTSNMDGSSSKRHTRSSAGSSSKQQTSNMDGSKQQTPLNKRNEGSRADVKGKRSLIWRVKKN